MKARYEAAAAGAVLACSFLFGSAARADGPSLLPGAPRIEAAAVTEACNAFAFDLYGRLARKAGAANLFFSPASICTALAMTSAGAAGATAAEMARLLHLEAVPALERARALGALLVELNTPGKDPEGKPAYDLVVSNGLWGQKGVPWRKEFVRLLADTYRAGLREVDFARASEKARVEINDWVASKTGGKIKDLIPAGVLGPLTRLVLTNAVYFKSKWEKPFEEGATRKEKFLVAPGKSTAVPLMNRLDDYLYFENGDLQLCELPYRNGDLSLVVLLPRKAAGLAKLEAALEAKSLATWVGKARYLPVILTLPRFRLESAFSLKDALAGLGLKLAFDEKAADFSGIAATEPLSIGAVLHKAFVAVDEKGTEAAAATVMHLKTPDAASDRPAPKVFRADHPFVFFILHRKSGAILFLGRVMDPAA